MIPFAQFLGKFFHVCTDGIAFSLPADFNQCCVGRIVERAPSLKLGALELHKLSARRIRDSWRIGVPCLNGKMLHSPLSQARKHDEESLADFKVRYDEERVHRNNTHQLNGRLQVGDKHLCPEENTPACCIKLPYALFCHGAALNRVAVKGEDRHPGKKLLELLARLLCPNAEHNKLPTAAVLTTFRRFLQSSALVAGVDVLTFPVLPASGFMEYDGASTAQATHRLAAVAANGGRGNAAPRAQKRYVPCLFHCFGNQLSQRLADGATFLFFLYRAALLIAHVDKMHFAVGMRARFDGDERGKSA